MTAFIVHLHVVLVYRYFVYAYIGSFFLCFGLLCTNKVFYIPEVELLKN